MDPGRRIGFAPIVQRFAAPAVIALQAQLDLLSLAAEERQLIFNEGREALHTNARLKLNRLLLLELHAAKRTGQLFGSDDAICFEQFIQSALEPAFATHLSLRYPSLEHRLHRALVQQCRAIGTLAKRFAEDRDALSGLLHHPIGNLTGITFGQGDLHAGGQSVARLTMTGGSVIYKPRSLRIDLALDAFLARVFGPREGRVRVPTVIDRDEYGWAAFVAHRYCQDEAELRHFYRGLGHWLAVLRLLGGTDIHLENLIASGPIPVVVDVESLFAPPPQIRTSGFGEAYDKARAIICGSVLRTGIVPLRTSALGFNNVDMSAAGALPDQQPQVLVPVMVDEGTTKAKVKVVSTDVSRAQNHPSPAPDVARYWDEISEGFLETSTRLSDMDASGELMNLLAGFAGCRVRDIYRSTQAYVEIGRMLWHPASLHEEDNATERARDLLSRNAAAVANAPSNADVIQSEIDDLRYGDVPLFSSVLTINRIEQVAADWRSMRTDMEELTIRSALVATDLNQRRRLREQERTGRLYAARQPHPDHLEERRRKLAKDAVCRLLHLAVRGTDGTATWITPEITHTGWVVWPVQPEVYFGLGGIVVALAGYWYEAQAGRVDTVSGLREVLDEALKTLRAIQALEKPSAVGGFNGFGAQIWTWVTLFKLMGDKAMLADAEACARSLQDAGFDSDQRYDIIDGSAGAIVPLLGLAQASGERSWIELAARAAVRLSEAAIIDDNGARWPSVDGGPTTGFAHGAAGIAWAVKRLAIVLAVEGAHHARLDELADAAHKFQESFYNPALGNWMDLSTGEIEDNFPTWCHGSVGIGIAAADLYDRTGDVRYLQTLERAIAQARGKWGASHTLCHGDFSLRELLVRGAGVCGDRYLQDVEEADAQIVSAIEEHRGMVGGLTRAAFTPGLMTGLAGAVHSLCRIHPECDLSSPLLLEV